MNNDFAIKFFFACAGLALLNAFVIVSVYLFTNQKLGDLEAVVKSYVIGSVIALIFYTAFFYIPNYNSHVELKKSLGTKYVDLLNKELQNKSLSKLIISHWFLNTNRKQRDAGK